MNFDKVQRGLIQKRKIFNDNPIGFRGFAFNMRVRPSTISASVSARTSSTAIC